MNALSDSFSDFSNADVYVWYKVLVDYSFYRYDFAYFPRYVIFRHIWEVKVKKERMDG